MHGLLEKDEGVRRQFEVWTMLVVRLSWMRLRDSSRRGLVQCSFERERRMMKRSKSGEEW